MYRFAVLLIALPLVLSAPPESTDKQGRSLVLPNTAAAGAVGGQYGQQTGAQETHDKKNFGLNYGSDRGSSSQYSNTAAQAGAAGSLAQGYSPYYQYPGPYPVYQPHYYYPGAPVGAGAVVGMQGIPGNLQVGSGAGVGIPHIPGGVPYRPY